MKKILMFMFVMIMLVSTVTAFNFDNTRRYDETTRTATIENAFGFGKDIATIQLDTELKSIMRELLLSGIIMMNFGVQYRLYNLLEFQGNIIPRKLQG